MERVFKIRTKSNRDPRAQYPSERRYSASIVIGLSVVYVQLGLYSVLMGSLIVHKMNFPNCVSQKELCNITDICNDTKESHMQQLHEKIGKDFVVEDSFFMRIPILTCVGCFLMSVGYFCAFITGLIAWKQWYIDHNITLFFLANTLSLITSALSLTISLITFFNINFGDNYNNSFRTQFYPLTLSLALNIGILSFIGVIWSILATRVGYKGMKTNYPDDMNFCIGVRHVEVNTVKKGNKNANIYPPDIINHFPITDKLAKYVPKINASNLPKAESNMEFQQRVNNFLSGEPVSKSNDI